MSDVYSFLIDSNIFVYAHDRSEPLKQKRATAILERLANRDDVCVTTQILGETFRVMTRKLRPPIEIDAARQQIAHIGRLWSVLPVTENIVLDAMRGVQEYQISYWDAQIWATARLAGVPIILSEDFNSGAEIETICFLNPFADNFDLEVLN